MAAATRKPSKARVARSKAYTEGLKMRRRWLGKAYVDNAFRDADDFSIDLQQDVLKPRAKIIEAFVHDDWKAPNVRAALKIAIGVFCRTPPSM